MSEFRIGSVPYLNAAPLTYGLEAECTFLPPSQLAKELHAGRFDAALVSVTEVLLHPGYDVLDQYAIGSDGEVFSVFLAHSEPLEVMQSVYLDPASCTSASLVRILLAARGIRPRFLPLAGYDADRMPRNAVLIGNPAIEFRRTAHSHQIWDLGAAWKEWTGLPFVFAVWAMTRRRDVHPLCERLSGAARQGLSSLSRLATERGEFDPDFRARYLGGYIRYRLGDCEKRAIGRFACELARYSAAPIQDFRFLSDEGYPISEPARTVG